ncbi:15712_t:CDS:2, partial [Dentiscutata heterogama]
VLTVISPLCWSLDPSSNPKFTKSQTSYKSRSQYLRARGTFESIVIVILLSDVFVADNLPFLLLASAPATKVQLTATFAPLLTGLIGVFNTSTISESLKYLLVYTEKQCFVKIDPRLDQESEQQTYLSDDLSDDSSDDLSDKKDYEQFDNKLSLNNDNCDSNKPDHS